MENILQYIENYGLSVVLLLGCMYALYKFFFFSIHQVKAEFEKRHDLMAQKMDEVKDELSGVKDKVNTLLEMIRSLKL